jgi:hypothetical protein
MTSREIHIADVYGRLREAIDEAGGQRAFAEKVGVSPTFVNLVVNAYKPPSDKILASIGIKREVKFVEIVS